MSDAQRGPETDTDTDVDISPAGPEPWWAGLKPAAGVALVVCGGALLLWLLLRGNGVEEHWGAYFGTGKVVALGLVVAGTPLVARRRGKGRGD